MGKVTYEGNQKVIEGFLLGIFTFYTTTLLLISGAQQWGRINDYVWMAGVLAAWTVHLSHYKTYEFRMRIFALLMQVSVILYAAHSEEFADAIPTFMVFVVLIGLSGRANLIFVTVFSILIIFGYHVFVSETIVKNDMSIALSQLANVFLLQFAVYTWTKRNSEGSNQLLSVIEELKVVQNSKDDFVANVSHEIRTPINTICGMSEILLREELPYHIKENVVNMQMAGRNLMGVVSDILDFSELQTGKIELEEEAYNITSTINDVINMAMAKKNEKKLELIVDCDATMPSVLMGDEKKLRRIIMNLVDNAVKFTEEGCVSLRIGYRKEEYGINLVISVKDTGIGISERDLEKIFTGFSQVDASRKRQEGGLGLGLAISNALINCMGGAITMKSKLRKGTIVQVVIPQKIMDSTPIASLNDRQAIKVATYIDMEQFDMMTIRDEYTDMILHMVEQLRGKCHICRNLAELQRRESIERFSHIFISIVEYQEDKEYFDALSKKTKVVVILNRLEEKYIDNPDILKIYKPFYILSIVTVLNSSMAEDEGGYQITPEKFTIRDAKVLVVDDNRMNLHVVEGILKGYQIEVVTAVSGAEALEKINTADFDFVFMDHMMPEMDGVETLHNIRQKMGTYFAKVPVVALTANAVAGTREILLEAGFNDFLEKPIERSVLERVLRRNLPADKIISKKAKGIVIESVEEMKDSEEDILASIRELEGLDVEQGILYCNGEEAYLGILQAYCQDWNSTGSLARDSFEQKDWKNYTIAVHGLKSAMFSIGAGKISEMAKQLEMAGKEGRIDYIKEHHQELMEAYEGLFERLKKNELICPVNVEEEEINNELPEVTDELLNKTIANMEDAMYALDADILLELIEEMEGYQYRGTSMKKILAPAKRKVEMADLFSAVETIKDWKNGLDAKEDS